MSNVAIIYGAITFNLSKLWKVKFSILCDVIFLVILQGNFDIDHSQEWKGSDSSAYYKVRQYVITKCDSISITKCSSYFITGCDQRYYKVQRVFLMWLNVIWAKLTSRQCSGQPSAAIACNHVIPCPWDSAQRISRHSLSLGVRYRPIACWSIAIISTPLGKYAM